MAFSIHIDSSDFEPQALALAAQIFERHAQEYRSSLPKRDPQFSVPEVAKELGVTPDTVREYFQLPKGHPRRLPYVDTTGSPRGYRVRDSDIKAFQERNHSDAAPVEVPVTRPARRA
ncbi:MAG TPA: helix-turn-helix domain-containing protein [Hymenobacter sp.]|jgi:predicted transcriptional regulator